MLTVITGPPCSGKTTYLNANAKPGDIRIDFDDLAQSLGSPVRHGHSEAIRGVTIMARRVAIEAAVSAHQRGAAVWVVDCNPTDARRRLYDQAGAEWVRLTADREELHRRAEAERPGLWHTLIDQWLGAPTATSSRRW